MNPEHELLELMLEEEQDTMERQALLKQLWKLDQVETSYDSSGAQNRISERPSHWLSNDGSDSVVAKIESAAYAVSNMS